MRGKRNALINVIDGRLMAVSVVIIAKNEESNIGRCLEALDNWCDDIVVVDDHSTDQTTAIALKHGARVATHRFTSFAEQRNWAMDACNLRHDWVLHLDADEVATPEFCESLRNLIETVHDDVVAFKLCRKTMLGNHWLKYSDGFPVWIMRVVRRKGAEFLDSGHGEIAVPAVVGTMEEIKEPIKHFAFSKGLTNWIERHNRYSTREAELEVSESRPLKWQGILGRDRSKRRLELRTLSRRLPFRASLRFLYQFVLKRGFLDGRAGWQFSQLMATYEGWIVAKKRELQLNRSEARSLPSVGSKATETPVTIRKAA